MSFDWTEARVETLRTLWAEGKSASEIYKAIGAVSRSAVIGKLHRLKVYRDGPAVRGERKQRRTRSNEVRAAYQAEWKRQRREEERLARESGLGSAPRVKEAKKTTPVLPTKPIEIVAPPSKRLMLLELTPHACRYIEDDSPPWTYCAHDALPGKSWCEAHYAVCVNRVSTSEANRRAARAANWQ